MDEYKPNSNKFKQESRDLKTQSTGIVKSDDFTVLNSRPGFRGLVDEFFKGDAKKIKRYLIHSVLIPKLKQMSLEMINSSARMSLYGDTKGPSGDKDYPNGTKYSYSKYYESDRRESDRGNYRRNDRPTYDNIVFRTSGRAEEVLDAMYDIINEYGVISVVTFLSDILELECDHTLDRYGWKDLSSAEVKLIPVPTEDGGYEDGYWLKLPKPRPIK